MTSAAVDNDVVIKLAAYRLFADGLVLLAGTDKVGVLGAARYVIPAAIARDGRIADRDGAIASWREVANALDLLEPSEHELDLAMTIEESAARGGLPLDPGESQLIAIAIRRPIARLATGDKRAIAAVETLRSELPELTALDRRVICFEQIMERLIAILGGAALQKAVCAEPKADRAVTICMGCTSAASGTAPTAEGLASYINDIRRQAPSLLGDL